MKWNFVGKRRKAHANADTHISSFNFNVESVSLGGLEGKTLAPKPSRFFSLGSNPVRAITIFSLFPLYFFFGLLSHLNVLLY
jgi:hypothetical protein